MKLNRITLYVFIVWLILFAGCFVLRANQSDLGFSPILFLAAYYLMFSIVFLPLWAIVSLVSMVKAFGRDDKGSGFTNALVFVLSLVSLWVILNTFSG